MFSLTTSYYTYASFHPMRHTINKSMILKLASYYMLVIYILQSNGKLLKFIVASTTLISLWNRDILLDLGRLSWGQIPFSEVVQMLHASFLCHLGR